LHRPGRASAAHRDSRHGRVWRRRSSRPCAILKVLGGVKKNKQF
jgi:hypothetical protein